MIIIKNIKVEPAELPNDGTGAARLSCFVFTPNNDAAITKVNADRDSFGGVELPMEPVEGKVLAETGDGVYSCDIQVPLLADPGEHELPIRARDTSEDSGAASAVVKVVYKRPAYEVVLGSPQCRETFERICKSPVLPGNSVELLADGPRALEKWLGLINGARKQINLQTYLMDDEGESGRIMEALLERAASGVEVNVILNAATQLAASPLSALRLKFQGVLRELQNLSRKIEQDLGVEPRKRTVKEQFRDIRQGLERGMREIRLRMFDPGRLRKARGPAEERTAPAAWLKRYAESRREPGRDEGLAEKALGFHGPGGLPAWPLLDHAIHEKILVVDGEAAIVGGRNLDDRFFGSWIDLDLVLHGPIVGQVQNGFLRSFAELSNEAQDLPQRIESEAGRTGQGGSDCQFVQSRPWSGELYAKDNVVSLIQMARRRVLISSQYLVLPPCLLSDALIDAARRGVEVVILTNSQQTAKEVALGSGFFISLAHFKPLLDAGIRIFTINGGDDPEAPQPYLHAKEFLIDGEVASIGSFNLSLRSCYIESEGMVNVFDPALTQSREQAFIRFITERAVEVTPDLLASLIEQHRGKMGYTRYVELLY